MRKSKAIKEANKMKSKIGQDCYVIKIKVPFKWYSVYTWFPTFENVSQDYIDFHTHNIKILYKTD